MYRVVLAGNDALACMSMTFLSGNPAVELLLLPEGRDADWEQSFQQMVGDCSSLVGVGSLGGYVSSLRSLKPDLIISLRGRTLVPPEVFEVAPVVNIHFGPLPRYGGCDPIFWQVRNGEESVGVTMHFMDEGFDTGPVLYRTSFNIKTIERPVTLFGNTYVLQGLTAWEAYIMAVNVGFAMFKIHFDNIVKGKLQQLSTSGKPLYYRKGSVDYAQDRCYDVVEKELFDEDLSNHIRAFYFPPCQYPVVRWGDREQEVQL